MSYRWATPLDWLHDRIAKAEDHQLLTYLNPLLADLDSDAIESDYRREMEDTGYFQEEEGSFERTGDYSAHEWLRFYVQDLTPQEQRREILLLADGLDSDTLQEIFQPEMEQEGYFTAIPAADAI